MISMDKNELNGVIKDRDTKSLVSEYIEKMISLKEARDSVNQEKIAVKKMESELLVSLNWDEINKFRKDKGLPKIGSDKTRQAYILMECGLINAKEELYKAESNLKLMEDELELVKYKFKLACKVDSIP